MEDDQQFCLRWNNHQSTLISVFDTLLENGTLVDCTLAAEGQFLKAHKVVLSACSPYFASLLCQQYDKHPIFILKDVKFQELRAMMDYMYRGEVNISQDQLAALLKAAESLQIKGLSDSRAGSSGTNVGITSGGQKQQINEHKQLPVSATAPLKSSCVSSGYTLEQKRSRHAIEALSIDSQDLAGSREGSSSPTSRKRKKIRRRSLDNIMADNHDHSNSSSHSMQVNSSIAPLGTSAAIGSATAAAASASSTSTTSVGISDSAAAGLNITKKTDNSKIESSVEGLDKDGGAVDHRDQEHQENNKPTAQLKKEQNHKRKSQLVDTDNDKDNSDLLIEPKNEYDDGNDETVEDLTLDEEDLLEDLEQAGPSHGGEGSSQGYAQWQVDRSQDEVFLAAQEAAGQQRDPQGENTGSAFARIRVRNWLMMTDRAKNFRNEEKRDGLQQRPRSLPSPDEQPCDLRLLTPASYFKEFVSMAAAASSSSLPALPSVPPRSGITSQISVVGSSYVADIAAAVAAVASPGSSLSATTASVGSQSNIKLQPPAHQPPLQRTKFGSLINLENIALTSTLPAGLPVKTSTLASPLINSNVKNAGKGSNCSSNSSNILAGTSSAIGSGGWGAFTCPRCGNSYARPHSLNRHIRFECGVEPKFECPICHKKSKHKHNLVLHMRTHQNR